MPDWREQLAKARGNKQKQLATISIATMVRDGDDAAFREFLSLLYAATSRLQAMRRELARSLGLGATDLSVILTIYTSGNSQGLRVKYIADNLHVAAANITASVNNLEKDRWIKKTNDKRDNRAILVSLTAEGQKRVDQFTDKLRNVNDIWFKDISEAERDHVKQFLHRIINQYDNAFHAARMVDWEFN
jgi:DNA-binding MarR family transcriptional regulator